MDLNFLEKMFESCLQQPFEITDLFDYLDVIASKSVIQTSSQQKRMLTSFTNKWKIRLHQNSKNMKIVNCTDTWTPCLSRVEKQDPWATFVRKYSPTFSECTVNSEKSPEFQPLNFDELVQLKFWKEVYETFGHRIISHIFEKCALVFKIDEGLYLIVAYSKGVMYSTIRGCYKKTMAVPNSRVGLPLLKPKNPYQLSSCHSPVVNLSLPLHAQEPAVENNGFDKALESCNHEDIEVSANLPVGRHTSDVNQEAEELPKKRMRTENDNGVLSEPQKKRMRTENDNGMLAETINRWISLKSRELEKLEEYRRNFYSKFSIPKVTLSTLSECGVNYVLIKKNEHFEPANKLAVLKQRCRIQVADPILPPVWQGLRLPEDLKTIAGNNGVVNFTVYTISETLALQLGFRVKLKKRCRKRKPVGVVEEVEGILESQNIQTFTNKLKKKTKLPSNKHPKGNNHVKKYALSAERCLEATLESYIPETTLPINSSLYNDSAWTKWPNKHGLTTAAAALPDNKHTAVMTLVQDIVNSKTCSTEAQERLVKLLEKQLQHGDMHPFKSIIVSIIQTHKKFTDMHKLLKNCLSFWRIKFFQKQQKRARKKGLTTEIMDKVSEKLVSSRSKMRDREVPECKSQPEPEVIDLTTMTSTPSTNFSFSDNPRVIQESPEVMEVNISSQSPQIVTSSSNTLNGTHTPLNRSNRTIKSKRIAGKLNKTFTRHMYINNLKHEIPYNCVMQTLKQIFHIMKIDSLLGSQRNKRGFFKFVRKAVILGGRRSSLQLGQLMASLNVEDMPLADVCGNDRNAAEIFASKVATWLFQEYILVLLKRSFYITECSASRYQLQFYLKETWISRSSKMRKQLFQKGVLNPQQDGPENALLRFIPKSNQTLRPLLIEKKTEKKLQAADVKVIKVMLHYIDSKINKTRLNAPNTIQRLWKNFVMEWKLMGCPKLFYSRTDIRDAYPSVSISQLKQILLDITREKGHRMVVKEFLVLAPGRRKLFRPSIFDAHCRNNWHSGIHSRPCLVMDLENDGNENAWNILEHVIDVLEQPNTVKLGKRFYNFSHGLPQGWGPSYILCSIYYGYMDSTMYLPFIESSGRFFLRLVDDYLFITPNPIEIANLNQLMKFGFEKYKIELHEGKSESNIYVRSNIPVPTRNCETVTFHGWNFCLTCTHVSRDYKKYKDQDLCSTVTFKLLNKIQSPEHFIRQSGTVISFARLQPIIIDPTINCNNRILLTAFEAAAFLSFRFYAICRVVYPSLSAIKEPERAKCIAMSIKTCCARVAGHLTRNSVPLGSTSASEEMKTLTNCENCCGGCVRQGISNENQQMSESHGRSSNISLSHDSLYYVVLMGFRITLEKHHEVFKQVIPQINKAISGLHTKLGNNRVTTILSVINGGKMPQCFEGINIKAFRKFVETGRVAFIAKGTDEGKLCAIINIIDSNRVLVDGPCFGVPRQEMSIKRLHLTNFSMKFPWTASTRVVRKAWAVDKIDEKWKASRWAQRVESRRKVKTIFELLVNYGSDAMQ